MENLGKKSIFAESWVCASPYPFKDMLISLAAESSANSVGIDSWQKWQQLHLLIYMKRCHVYSNLTKIFCGYLILFSAETGFRGFFQCCDEFKEAWWSTMLPSVGPKILRYDLYSYRLLLSKENIHIFYIVFGYYPFLYMELFF